MEVIIVFFILITLLLSLVGPSLRLGISPTPSSGKFKVALLKEIPLEAGLIHELGSGWGHLVVPLCRHFPKAKVIGYEASFFPWVVSIGVKYLLSLPNLELKYKNFLCDSVKESEVIVCYLFPKAMEKLAIKFKKELKPGVLIISNTFALPGWSPIKVIELQDLYSTKIYLYRSE